MTIVQMSAIPRFHAARKGADAAVLTHDGCAVSWGELEVRANRRARLFASAGVKAGDFVTIALPNGNEFYETTVLELAARENSLTKSIGWGNRVFLESHKLDAAVKNGRRGAEPPPGGVAPAVERYGTIFRATETAY